MNGVFFFHALFAAETHTQGSPGSLGVVEFLLLFVAAGFLLYVFAGQKQPSRVVMGLVCLGAAAAACGAFLFAPLGHEQKVATEDRAPATTRQADELSIKATKASTPAVDETATTTTDVNETKKGDVRPSWLDQPPAGFADGVYREVVSSGKYATWKECQRALDDNMYEAVYEYLSRYHEVDYAYSPHRPVTRDFIERRILKETFTEQVQSERAGEMYQMHALLEFDEAVRTELQQSLVAYHAGVRERDRLLGVGGLAALVLALIAAVYGYLRIDTATKGYYSGRLKLGLVLVAAAIVVGAVAIVEVVRWDQQLPSGLERIDSRRAAE